MERLTLGAVVVILSAAPALGDSKLVVQHAPDGRLLRQPPVIRAGELFRIEVSGVREPGQAVLASGDTRCTVDAAGTVDVFVAAEAQGGMECSLEPGTDGTVSYTLLRKIQHGDGADAPRARVLKQLEDLQVLYGLLAGRLVGTEPWPPLGLDAPKCGDGAECGLKDLAAAIEAAQLARERVARYVDQAKAQIPALVHDEDARHAGLKVMAALADFDVRVAAQTDVMTKAATELASSFTSEGGLADCQRVFAGELLLGSSRRVVAFERDASFLGGVTSESFRLTDADTVFFYVQDHGGSTARYEVAVKVNPKAQPVFKTLSTEMLPIGIEGLQPKAVCGSVANAPPKWVLRRVSQGARFSGDSEVVLTLNTEDGAPPKASARPAGSVDVLATYHLGVNSGLLLSKLGRPSFFNSSSATVLDKGGRSVILPMLNVTYFLRPRSYVRYKPFDAAYLIPNPVVGFRLDSPGSDFFYGGSIEPVRGVQLLLGRNRGVRSVLVEPGRVGEPILLDAAGKPKEPTTKEAFQEKWAWGVSFDVNLFADKLLKLVGF